jgi:hypothetical protein
MAMPRKIATPHAPGVARNPGKPVILIAAKNLAGITEILRRAQNDGNAKKDRRAPCAVLVDLRTKTAPGFVRLSRGLIVVDS